jgi:hypothetical protein
MNQELREMFVADQVERNNHLDNDTPEYLQLRERDAQRRQRVSEMMAGGTVGRAQRLFSRGFDLPARRNAGGCHPERSERSLTGYNVDPSLRSG